MSLGFIIPSYCSEEQHIIKLKECIHSIRKYYKYNKIVIINDDSPKEILFDDPNIIIEKSVVNGGADMTPYYLLYKNHYFDKALIIQDSMCINKKLENLDDIKTIKYLWYFTNHRVDWSTIKENQTEYNVKNNIKTHDDLIIDCIKKYCKNKDFQKYALDIYFQKDNWSGCFGTLSIIDYNFLKILEEKTGIIDTLLNFNTNRLRRVAESIFSLACKYILEEEVFETGYDGLYYDGKKTPKGRNNEYCCKKKYFSKISFNRKNT